MSVKLLTEHHLEFPSLKGGCIGLFESTLVKMPHCWKSHFAAHIILLQVSEDVTSMAVEKKGRGRTKKFPVVSPDVEDIEDKQVSSRLT